MSKTRFRLGQVLATPGALDALEAAGQDGRQYLKRHQSGDWGEVCPEDYQCQSRAVANEQFRAKPGSAKQLRRSCQRLMSAYALPTGAKLWVITEADRSITTVLLPEEY